MDSRILNKVCYLQSNSIYMPVYSPIMAFLSDVTTYQWGTCGSFLFSIHGGSSWGVDDDDGRILLLRGEARLALMVDGLAGQSPTKRVLVGRRYRRGPGPT